MIKGVQEKALKQIADDRGKIMHMIRATDPDFKRFGEIYFSWINPGIVKGWHKHSVTTVNFAVPVGQVKIVIFDDRKNSQTKNQTQEFVLGPDHYKLLTIAPGLWYGFSSLSKDPAMIANCASHPHDPDESEKRALDEINYDWGAS